MKTRLSIISGRKSITFWSYVSSISNLPVPKKNFKIKRTKTFVTLKKKMLSANPTVFNDHMMNRMVYFICYKVYCIRIIISE